MYRNSWILPLLIVILAVSIFTKPYYGLEVRKLLAPEFGAQNVNSGDLAAENESLKAELAKLQNIKLQFPDRSPNFIGAAVYSRYPFNFKNELLLNAGSSDGVALDKAVIASGILIGKVVKVFESSAVAQTVFDGGFQTSVRVGSAGLPAGALAKAGAQALIVGGALPKLTMIPLGVNVSPGDIVYSASPDFPYGLPIAEVAVIATSSDNLFREATLDFAYDINSVSAVMVAK